MNHDENPIVVFTPYTYEQMKTYQLVHLGKQRWIWIGAGAAVFIWVGVLFMQTGSFDFLLHNPMIVAALMCAALLLLFSIRGFYSKKQHEASTASMKDGVTYRFGNQAFTVEIHGSGSLKIDPFRYANLAKVTETKDMFYLYRDKRAAFLVDKAGFKEGTVEDFRSLMRQTVAQNRCKLL